MCAACEHKGMVFVLLVMKRGIENAVAYMQPLMYFYFHLFQLPAAVGEAPTFGFAEDMANKFFNPDGVRTHTTWIFFFCECAVKT